ncbi:YceH family protein [Ectopseudomonas khazarica]|uniref:YceH family protein n=1 Tax=Ectopseudomonas khazarica TaxID=2502979 RepID=A0ABW7M8A3_9GAMM
MSHTPSPLVGESPLHAIEVRILGCLIEKQLTTPESYPLTLNAVQLACNQKTSREPLMNLESGEVGRYLRSLEGRQLVHLQMGSRADRWEQRCDKQLELVKPQTVLLGLLMLRGPQTLNELLTRSNRMYDFDDVAEIQHQLERLIGRGLAILLPRQTGQREDRYMHLLGEPADLESLLASRPSGRNEAAAPNEDRLVELEARIAALEERLARLEGAQ